ncbi:PIG-L deacetylase family protein [Streptomyces cinereospinus]|uniref:PIG-L deacetylase family protein n=1 Tax=Streptomyces cinereospinus TaxID=285561 RepID=A0ABV5N6X9_9ACTN
MSADEDLPIGTRAGMDTSRRTVMVVVAHADDAEIAAGGTIARLSDAGVRVVTAVLSLAETGPSAEQRIADTERAAGLLGYELRWPRGEPALQVSDYGEVALVATLDRLMTEIAPQTVLTHWRGDGHVDHALTGRAVAAALRNHRADLFSLRPAEPRTIATSQFCPTVFVDITDQFKRKAEALEPFTRPRPGFRPVDGAVVQLADRFHGQLSGTEYAEAFALERQHGLGAALPQG